MSSTHTPNRPNGSAVVFKAVCCVFQACDLYDILIGCKSKNECLCLTGEECCAMDTEPLGCGLMTGNETNDRDDICKIACFCCTRGLKFPTKLCAGAVQLCCIKEAVALPFDEKYGVKEPMCAYLFCQCLPTCEFAAAAPRIPVLEELGAKKYSVAPESEMMERGGALPEAKFPPMNPEYRDEVVPVVKAGKEII